MLATDSELARQRERVRALLDGGLQTQWQARAYTSEDVRRAVDALQAIAPDHLEDKLRVAGFTLQPYVNPNAPEIEQACRTCMYYESHRRYCDLPELKLGVDPDWSCILWRV